MLISVNSTSKQTLSPWHSWMSFGPVCTPVLIKLVIPLADGLLFKQLEELIISNWKSWITLPTKFPDPSNSSINTATTKLPVTVGVNWISPVAGSMVMPAIGETPE